MTDREDVVVVFGVFMAVVLVGFAGVVFTAAYANGGQLLLEVNRFGEADVEFAALIVATAFSLYALATALSTVDRGGGAA